LPRTAILFHSEATTADYFASISSEVSLRETELIAAPLHLLRSISLEEGACTGPGPFLLVVHGPLTMEPPSKDAQPLAALAAASDRAEVYDGELSDRETVLAFLAERRLPILGHVSPANFGAYRRDERPLVWLLVNASASEAETSAAMSRVRSAARPLSQVALFGWLDGDAHASHARALGAHALPALAADVKGEHFVFPRPLPREADSSAEVSDAITSWMRAVLDGSVAPTLRSEELPIDNFGPVTRVVGSSLSQLVLRAKLNVLLEVTAPWATGAAESERLIQSFGAMWESERLLRVATIDVSRNDLPRALQVLKLPSLLFFKLERGSELEYIDFSAHRSRSALDEAVRSHATSGTGAGAAPLSRPSDTEELTRLVAMLEPLGTQARLLLDENARLREGLAASRAAHRASP